MKNKIIQELKYFNGIEFHEEEHFYTLNDYRFGISATSLIETYAQEFDSEKISQMVANKEKITQQEVLNKWKKENQFSCIKGSLIHCFAQGLWMNSPYKIDYSNIDNIDVDRLKTEIDIMKNQAINFYNDYKDKYDMIQDEFIVWSKEYDIAGSIDGIMYNKYTQQCCILDFKSNKDLQFQSKYHKKMKIPLHELDDVNGQHYYIQLSIYRYLIEKYTNIKIDELFIVYFNINAKNYEIIPIPYLEEEVKNILELRRVKNIMGKCIPVLIIGKSGSGKSTSLRNLSKEDYSLVNPLAKRLPFKGGQQGYETCNYEEIKNFIAKTPKKIIVIDDSNYLLTVEMMAKAKESGYNKFTDIALNYWKLIEFIKNLDGDKRVYLMSHEEIDEYGNIGVKTVGKMLSNQCCVEGLYTIVLRAENEGGKFNFRTKTAGNDIVKTPIGMFEEEIIDNDLALVDKTICEYYEIEEVKEGE